MFHEPSPRDPRLVESDRLWFAAMRGWYANRLNGREAVALLRRSAVLVREYIEELGS